MVKISIRVSLNHDEERSKPLCGCETEWQFTGTGRSSGHTIEDLHSVKLSYVLSFTDYLAQNSISETANFPSSLWASTSTTSERTINSRESFYAKFRKHFNNSRPDIFFF